MKLEIAMCEKCNFELNKKCVFKLKGNIVELCCVKEF